MRIGIITSDPGLDSCRLLGEQASSRGHQWIPLELLRVSVTSSTPHLLLDGEEVPPLDAAIIRLGAVLPGLVEAAGRALEQLGVVLLDEIDALLAAQNKMHTIQILSAAGLPVPVTELIRDLDQLEDALKRVGGVPAVIKPLHGSQGRGVILAESCATAVTVMESVLFQSKEFILQQYIECGGRDYRVLVIDGEVSATMERTAPPGDFRSNLHSGGESRSIDPQDDLKALALEAAHHMNLRCAGVDIVDDGDQLRILEVNGSPGLMGIGETTGVDVARCWIEALESAFEAAGPSVGGERSREQA